MFHKFKSFKFPKLHGPTLSEKGFLKGFKVSCNPCYRTSKGVQIQEFKEPFNGSTILFRGFSYTGQTAFHYFPLLGSVDNVLYFSVMYYSIAYDTKVLLNFKLKGKK